MACIEPVAKRSFSESQFTITKNGPYPIVKNFTILPTIGTRIKKLRYTHKIYFFNIPITYCAKDIDLRTNRPIIYSDH